MAYSGTIFELFNKSLLTYLRVYVPRLQIFRQMKAKPQAILYVLASETFVSLGFLAKYGEKDASGTYVKRYVGRL